MKETHLQEEGVAEKRARTEKSDTETEAGGEAGTIMIQEDNQHLPDGLGSYCGLCEGPLGVVKQD